MITNVFVREKSDRRNLFRQVHSRALQCMSDELDRRDLSPAEPEYY